jgi:hypothetical protein
MAVNVHGLYKAGCNKRRGQNLTPHPSCKQGFWPAQNPETALDHRIDAIRVIAWLQAYKGVSLILVIYIELDQE